MDQALLARVDEWLGAHRQEIIDDLIGLVRIPSVSVPDEAVPPYGQACRDALQYMFDLGARHGYRSRNYDNYVGAITFSEGEGEVGIWAHLDVVPVPDPADWDYPPFEGTLVDNRYLIGRGVQDNKMAAIGVFHVMNCLRELGVPLKHRYSLYMGTSEETGMEDARYFAAHYPCPDLSIVPDTGFPVCCAQRGCMVLGVSVPFAHQVTIRQSNNPSVTPEEITALLEDGRALTARGDSSHIFNAARVDNAILRLMDMLGETYPAEVDKLRKLRTLLDSWHGESLGIDYADELSGALQMGATELVCDGERLEAKVYIIVPVTADAAELTARAEAKAAGVGASVRQVRLRPSCSFSMDHPVVTALTDTYNEVMGQDSKPFVMSGGNYAAYLPNAFGFGPGMPGREFPPHIFRKGRGDYHQCDESEDIDHTLNFMRVYAMSIVALNGMDVGKEK
ncbi:MAG: M20/M25/M40 family metallo-hydrolase [Eubacteriales bacterium]|nr:M20/M25/M40 family metallo-hydrolase [Eubacteriales bacterium]